MLDRLLCELMQHERSVITERKSQEIASIL